MRAAIEKHGFKSMKQMTNVFAFSMYMFIVLSPANVPVEDQK